MIKISPYASESQRAWMHIHKPEMAKEWDKHTPKGKKLPKHVSKASRLNAIRNIIAEDVQTQISQPVGGQVQQPQQNQNQRLDSNTLMTMIPQIMHQLDTSNLGQVRDYITEKMNVNPQVAQKAVGDFGAKIYKEELTKRRNQTIQDVAKKMGINPDVVKGWDKPSALPPLPQTTSSIHRRQRINLIVNADLNKTFNKIAETKDIIEKATNLPIQEKIKNLIKFFSNFSSVEEGVNSILGFVRELSNQVSMVEQPVTAKLSDKVNVISSILWVVTIMLALGAAGTSDFNQRYWISHPDDAQAVKAMTLTIESFGAALLTSALVKFLKNKENNNQKEELKKNRMYQGDKI